ncbi:hypothetical protein BZA77DRAFT_127354 [Pyronema omphalodes]|nr:hypothetical protein BZA77DRAFT_127354 [Pyronema omphalodes]
MSLLATPSPPPILTLPTELHLLIAQHLPPSSLLTLSLFPSLHTTFVSALQHRFLHLSRSDPSPITNPAAWCITYNRPDLFRKLLDMGLEVDIPVVQMERYGGMVKVTWLHLACYGVRNLGKRGRMDGWGPGSERWLVRQEVAGWLLERWPRCA